MTVPVEKPVVGAFRKFIKVFFYYAVLVEGSRELAEGRLGCGCGAKGIIAYIVAETSAREEYGNLWNVDGTTYSCDT